mgnify:CR=1 FL=1
MLSPDIYEALDKIAAGRVEDDMADFIRSMHKGSNTRRTKTKDPKAARAFSETFSQSPSQLPAGRAQPPQPPAPRTANPPAGRSVQLPAVRQSSLPAVRSGGGTPPPPPRKGPRAQVSPAKVPRRPTTSRGLSGGKKALLGLGITGAGTLAYGLHRRNKKNSRQKTASIAGYSVLFDKVASGDLGEHARQALLGICDTIPEPATLSEKSASVYDAIDLSEDAARKARLDQLLRR